MPILPSPTRAHYPHEFVTLEVGQNTFKIKADAFFEAHDPSIIRHFLAAGASVPNFEEPLVLKIPRDEPKPYPDIVRWMEQRHLPQDLSDEALNLIADEADYLCMEQLEVEASTLYPLRAELARLAPGSSERAIATARYADTLDQMGDVLGGAQWFRQAQHEMPPGSPCLVSYYEQKLTDPSEEGLKHLRLASLGFSPRTHELRDEDPAGVLSDLFTSLAKRPDDPIALNYLTTILRTALPMTEQIETYTTIALCRAIEANPHSTQAELACLLLCNLLPQRRALIEKLGDPRIVTAKGRTVSSPLNRDAEEHQETSSFEQIFRLVSAETQAHPLAQLARLRYRYQSTPHLRDTAFKALLDAAENFFDLQARAGCRGENLPLSCAKTVVLRSVIDSFCDGPPLGREELTRASQFCMRSAPEKALEFARQKFALLVGGAYSTLHAIGQNRSFSRDERNLLRAELQLRSGTAGPAPADLLRVARHSKSDVGTIVSYLIALSIINQSDSAPPPPHLTPLLSDLARRPGAGAAASYLQAITASDFATVSPLIASYEVGSLAYYLLCNHASATWPEAFRAHNWQRLAGLFPEFRGPTPSRQVLREAAWCFFWGQHFQRAHALLIQEARSFSNPICARPLRALCFYELGDYEQARDYIEMHQDITDGALPYEGSLTRYVLNLNLERIMPPREALKAVLDNVLTHFSKYDLLDQETFLAQAKNLRAQLVEAETTT